MRKFHYTRGTVLFLGDLEQIRRPNMSDIFKRYISVKIHNTEQILHLEVRNSGLRILDHLDLSVGSEILFSYEFQGKILDNKETGAVRLINNILLTQIKKYIPNFNSNRYGDRKDREVSNYQRRPSRTS